MRDFLKFDWQPIKVAVEGASFLDSARLNLQTKAEARAFLYSYGYDIDDSFVHEELWRIYFQSVAFIRDQLLDPGEKIPSPFLSRGPMSEITRLLMLASEAPKGGAIHTRQRSEEGRWACAILRVMHIISHLDNDVRLEIFRHAREQIFERFDAVITQSESRRWKFGFGANSVPLVRYIKKERKERSSILIKLLSKPHNVVEEIYDRIGVRFVTDSRYDCYRLIQKAIELGVISAPNIQPGRSVNSLLPLDVMQQTVEQVSAGLKEGSLNQKMAKKQLERLEDESLVPIGMVRNPFSSRWYRAIQFTCRQMISAPDPTFVFWKQIKRELEKSPAGKAAMKKIPLSLRERRTFYYPFEVQIVDKDSYVEAIGGRSRHREYKAKQRIMARNRVLRDLV